MHASSINEKKELNTEEHPVAQLLSDKYRQTEPPQIEQTGEQQIDTVAAIMLAEARKQANQQGVAMTALLSKRFKDTIKSLGISL